MARSEFAEQFADLVEQDEAYRERIQRALIPRELLLLPEAFERFQARVEERFTQVDQEIANVRAEMREGFARDEEFANACGDARGLRTGGSSRNSPKFAQSSNAKRQSSDAKRTTSPNSRASCWS
jgi:general stress protein YciG